MGIMLDVLMHLINIALAAAFILLKIRNVKKNKDDCKRKIPVLSLITAGLVFAGCTVYIFLSDSVQMPIVICVTAMLWLCAFASDIDIEKRIIPNLYPELIAGLAVVKNAYLYFSEKCALSDFIYPLAGALLGFAVMALSGVLVKDGVGGGDIKLVTAVCLCYGLFSAFGFLFNSVLCAALFGIGLVIFTKKDRKSKIPFAPFVLIGAMMTSLSSLI